MALNINGTTGISGVDGSVSAPALTGTDSNTGITFPSADTIKFATGGVERMQITNSGVTGTGIGSGKILQVVPKNDTTVYSTTSQSYQQATQSDTIQLSNNSNKVLVMVNFMAYADSRYSGHLSLAAAIYRGSVASGTKITGGTQPMLFRSAGFSTEYYVGFCTLMFVDTPGGDTTYSLGFKQNNSSGSEAKIFGSQMNTVMILQEIEQ